MKVLGVNGATDGIVTATGGATHYCISAQEGTHFAHVVGPGGNIVSTDLANFCATWVAN
jgi:hypothetical protein